MALTDNLFAIGDAIRERTGGTELIPLVDMPEEILNIPGGVDPSGYETRTYCLIGGVYRNYLDQQVDPAAQWRSFTNLATASRSAANAVWNNEVIIAGGYSYTTRIESVNIITNERRTWASLPASRSNFSGVTVNDEAVFPGGNNNSGTAQSTVYSLDLVNNTMRTLTPLSETKNFLSCIDYNNEIIIAGGGKTTVEAIDIVSNTRRILPPCVRTKTGSAAVIWNDELFLIGGSSTAYVDVLDLITETWRLAPNLPPEIASKLVTPHYGVFDNWSAMISSTGELVRYNLDTGRTWATNINNPFDYITPGSTKIGNEIFFAGGQIGTTTTNAVRGVRPPMIPEALKNMTLLTLPQSSIVWSSSEISAEDTQIPRYTDPLLIKRKTNLTILNLMEAIADINHVIVEAPTYDES